MLRYLKDSIDNELDRTWNKEMRSLLQDMIHFCNGCQPFLEPDPVKISELEKRYREVLETVRTEYGNVPANKYYRDGYNLFLRMEKYMKNNTRISRINDEIFKEVSQIVRGELKDPRIGAMTSVVRVDTTQDLKYCKVYVSVLGDENQKASVMKGLKNASGFIRHLVAERVNLRLTPELIFKLDESAEYAVRMEQLMAQIAKDREEREVQKDAE